MLYYPGPERSMENGFNRTLQPREVATDGHLHLLFSTFIVFIYLIVSLCVAFAVLFLLFAVFFSFFLPSFLPLCAHFFLSLLEFAIQIDPINLRPSRTPQLKPHSTSGLKLAKMHDLVHQVPAILPFEDPMTYSTQVEERLNGTEIRETYSLGNKRDKEKFVGSMSCQWSPSPSPPRSLFPQDPKLFCKEKSIETSKA